MKTVLLGLLVATLTGCATTRGITEQYIKTELEEHEPGEYSEIRTFPIYQSSASSAATQYLELTGYKYKGAKGLVVGADKYFRQRPKFVGDQSAVAKINYVPLTDAQAQKLASVVDELLNKLRSNKATTGSEEMYQDYTITPELFVSYKRSRVGMIPSLWVNGMKFPFTKEKFLNKMKRFLEY